MKSTARRRNGYRNSHAYRLFLPLFLAAIAGIHGLENVSIDIPEAVAVGTTVTLTCKYNLGKDPLYTVKWYKGQKEFYRYLPKEDPAKSTFGDFGSKIDKARSDEHRVVLTNVTPDFDGKYRCEVSKETDFSTMVVSGYMHVASLSKGGPVLRVEKPRYEVGDVIRGNCTTPPSNPPANVTWIINGNPINASSIKRTNPKGDNRTVTFVTLDFEIIPDSFKNGRLQIVCHANVFQLYNERADVVLDEERPKLASVLGAASRAVAQWIYVGAAANWLLSGLR
ncbi:uncharacterized protein [Venturia canescens]|uniref:uncharacterized protein isoform X2 n=1 Tax=Venturia canescens TaxID=32260 RepID=UPI001C9D1472|nr:uncharacterized protein LOC122410276 isoform X2 [Venturia canescens]